MQCVAESISYTNERKAKYKANQKPTANAKSRAAKIKMKEQDRIRYKGMSANCKKNHAKLNNSKTKFRLASGF